MTSKTCRPVDRLGSISGASKVSATPAMCRWAMETAVKMGAARARFCLDCWASRKTHKGLPIGVGYIFLPGKVVFFLYLGGFPMAFFEGKIHQ